MFSFIDQCEDQLLNKHSVPLLENCGGIFIPWGACQKFHDNKWELVVSFLDSCIYCRFHCRKGSWTFKWPLLKKKILRKAIELPILGQNLDNCGSAQEMQYGFWPWVGKKYMIVWEVTGKRFEICTQSFSQGQNIIKTN